MGHVDRFLGPEGRDFAAQQLHEAGHEPGSEVAVVVGKVLDVVDNWIDSEPDPLVIERTLSIIAHLICGEVLRERHWTDAKKAEGYVWRPIMPRSLNLGDVVRVRQDAYTDPNLVRHNGRQGTVAGIRYGNVNVLYDGASGMGVQHKPDVLERRLKAAPSS